MKTELTPEQMKAVGAAFRRTYTAIGADLINGPHKRKDLIEICADYVHMYGMREVTDPVVRDYLENRMFGDPDLVSKCVASGHWSYEEYE